MFASILALGLVATNPLTASETVRMQNPADGSGLAAAALSEGRAAEAIQTLSRAHSADRSDPAVLINLGIAHAQRGEDAAAQDLFRAAMTSPVSYELETAEGTAMDSRKLARRALRMLERGEFRSSGQQPSHLTLRD